MVIEREDESAVWWQTFWQRLTGITGGNCHKYRFCDKNILAATKPLLWQNCCRDKTVVATNTCLSCPDKHTCGSSRQWSTRKLTIQRINFGSTSSLKSLPAMRCGYMDLKAGQKSLKKNRWRGFGQMNPFFQGEYNYAVCKRVSVASSVLLLCLDANWYGSKWGFVCMMNWWRMLRSKHSVTINVKAIGRWARHEICWP